jgi:hypothetical protein
MCGNTLVDRGIAQVAKIIKTVLKEGGAMGDNKTELKLTAKEKKVIEIIRSTAYGRLRIMVQEGQPVRVEEVTKSIKL